MTPKKPRISRLGQLEIKMNRVLKRLELILKAIDKLTPDERPRATSFGYKIGRPKPKEK